MATTLIHSDFPTLRSSLSPPSLSSHPHSSHFRRLPRFITLESSSSYAAFRLPYINLKLPNSYMRSSLSLSARAQASVSERSIQVNSCLYQTFMAKFQSSSSLFSRSRFYLSACVCVVNIYMDMFHSGIAHHKYTF